MKKSLGIDRDLALGVAMIVILGLIATGTVAIYRGAFDDTVDVTVESDRAGLTLSPGTPVKLYGVEVGRVGEIRSDGDRVLIELELDADEAGQVPGDVSAQIVPPTAFGAKYVQLTAIDGDHESSIEAGDVIPATRVTVEVDEAFTNLTEVLDAARPAQVNSALTAVAGAIDQRGEVIGELITKTDAYLSSFNPSLTTLANDLRLADDVADLYDVARPDVVNALDDGSTTLDTLVSQHASLRALELSLTSFSASADTLIRRSQRGIVTSLELLDPVTEVLARYSPELPCLVLGLASANKLAEDAVGGTNPGITTYTRIVPGRDPYAYPEDLNILGEDRGPGCWGLPYVSPSEAELTYGPTFNTGTDPYRADAPANGRVGNSGNGGGSTR